MPQSPKNMIKINLIKLLSFFLLTNILLNCAKHDVKLKLDQKLQRLETFTLPRSDEQDYFIVPRSALQRKPVEKTGGNLLLKKYYAGSSIIPAPISVVYKIEAGNVKVKISRTNIYSINPGDEIFLNAKKVPFTDRRYIEEYRRRYHLLQANLKEK